MELKPPKNATLDTCRTCGARVDTHHGYHRGRRRGYAFCSRTCSGQNLKKLAVDRAPQRFWSKVTKGRGCWVWSGHIDKSGYGRATVAGKYRLAHRVAWELHNGTTIPPGMVVCHSCDNPPCCNPNHLWVGTQDDNVKDMKRKGRANTRPTVVGAAVNTAKLTAQQVRVIRASTKTSKDLAASFGVSATQIWNIRSGRHWRHV